MAKSTTSSRKPTKETPHRSSSQKQNVAAMEKPPPPWARMKNILTSPEALKKRVGSFSNDGSNRSMKTPSREISNNGAMGVVNSLSSTSSSSLLSASSNGYSVSGGGSFRAMPFRRFSGCYECRMVVDPVLGFARDPSLRASICTCPVCGEIFMKPGNFCQVHNSEFAFDKKILPV